MKKQIIQLKSPFGYYGGKQRLAKRILTLIPNHRTYVEPFFGGGAIFFAKPPSEVEVINDTNHELINFYKVLKQEFIYLIKEINISLHSRLMQKLSWRTLNYSLPSKELGLSLFQQPKALVLF